MLHLTWKILANPDSLSALGKLSGSNQLDFKSAYSAGKIAEACRSQMRVAHEKNMEILHKHAKKDENGVLIPAKNGEFEFVNGNKEVYEKEVSALANNSFSVKTDKIQAVKLPEKLLTGAELVALEDVLEGLDALIA